MKLVFLLFFPFLLQAQTSLLDGSKSLYADKYHWQQISGQPVTLLTPDSALCIVQDFQVEGVYQFELLCTNAYGRSVDTTMITVVSQSITNVFIQDSYLTWTTTNEDNVQYFIIEEGDGQNFIEINRIVPKGASVYKQIIR